MKRSVSFMTTLIFTFGFYASTRSQDAPKPSGDETPVKTRSNAQLLNTTAVNEFLEAVEDSSLDIQIEVDSQVQDLLNSFNRANKTGASRDDFLFSVSIVKESIVEVMTLVNNLKRKIELLEKEKTLRELTARLMLGDYRISAVEPWVTSKGHELNEEMMNLWMRYTELSNLYQNYLTVSRVLKRRLAIAESYYPTDRETSKSDCSSNRTTAVPTSDPSQRRFTSTVHLGRAKLRTTQ